MSDSAQHGPGATGLHRLILGGQKSGKSREAERAARRWCEAAPGRDAMLVATALPGDEEMRARIARHRAQRLPGIVAIEEPLALAATLARHAAPQRLIVVDCLTLWLTNWLMPLSGQPDETGWAAERAALLDGLSGLASPVVFVSNEIGWGVSPLSRETRRFIDELGRLHQDVAQRCGQLTLMVAGQAWTRDVVREP